MPHRPGFEMRMTMKRMPMKFRREPDAVARAAGDQLANSSIANRCAFLNRNDRQFRIMNVIWDHLDVTD